MEYNADYFKENLKILMDKCDMTADALASYLGVSPDTVNSWRKAASRFPRVDILAEICNVFNCDMNYLFTPPEEHKPLSDTNKLIEEITGLSQKSIEALQFIRASGMEDTSVLQLRAMGNVLLEDQNKSGLFYRMYDLARKQIDYDRSMRRVQSVLTETEKRELKSLDEPKKLAYSALLASDHDNDDSITFGTGSRWHLETREKLEVKEIAEYYLSKWITENGLSISASVHDEYERLRHEYEHKRLNRMIKGIKSKGQRSRKRKRKLALIRAEKHSVIPLASSSNCIR